VIELKRSAEGKPEEMVDLFSIDDVVYQVPARPRVNVALQYLENMRTVGVVVAEMMLIEKLVGEKGYKALCDYDELRPEDMSAISDAVVKLTLGALENNSGNDDSGSSKSDG
jgi:hypothetical protein